MIRQDGPTLKDEEIEVTPEMISAGWRVLDESGIVEGYDAWPSHSEVVREIYQAMKAVAQ